MEIVKGKTRSGFEFEFDRENLDMECIDMLGELEDNPLSVGKILKHLLGKEQKKRLYDSLRNERGHVPPDKTMEAFTDILNTSDESKNS
jgi:hypothetical protein